MQDSLVPLFLLLPFYELYIKFYKTCDICILEGIVDFPCNTLEERFECSALKDRCNLFFSTRIFVIFVALLTKSYQKYM